MTNITVLMPLRAYYRRFLDEALDSVLNQSSPHWELKIIVEPADSDKFQKLLHHVLQDPRVELVGNRGRKLAGAINTGMSAAKTEFVAILLADDKWAPQAVEVLGKAIKHHPGSDYFHSSRRYIDETGGFISSEFASRENVTLADFKTGTPVKHLLCWRRSLALQCGGMDETLNSVGPDDFDFPWIMAENGAIFQSVSDCLYYYREHDACFRLTTGLPLSVHQNEIRRVLQKHGLAEKDIDAWVEHGTNTYLKQCKFDSYWQRWLYKLTRKSKPMLRPEYK